MSSPVLPSKALAGLDVLVVGDAMLDSYLEGSSGRLCQEAPVPVVSVSSTRRVPGGAANAAANAAALGARVRLVAAVGDDWEGSLLESALKLAGVPTEGMVRQPGRRTLAKSRVSAAGQLLLRFDQGSTEAVDVATQRRLIDQVRAGIGHAAAVVVSDYGYGVCSEALIQALGEMPRDPATVLAVDAKELGRYRSSGATLVKPNFGQACRLLGEPATPPGRRVDAISGAAQRLHEACGARIVAVTLDAEGAIVLERGRPAYRTYSRPHGHTQAAGAGDTYLTTMALAIAGGADVPQAAEWASAASAVVMGKPVTAACAGWELDELLAAGGKQLSPSAAERRAAFYRSQGRRIILTTGCFDILHRGHTTLLSRAKALGDVLIVGVNSDASVRRLKGGGRPVNRAADRVAVLSALSCVDHVVIFDEDDPRRLIAGVAPDAFVKGGDYRVSQLVEADTVRAAGGEVQILPYEPDESTTSVIARIRGGALAVP